jgi:putative nucleotidyltransferase with HDIG domain
MEAIKIPVNNCSAGDILAADVYNENGILMVAKDTIINSFIKSKLTHMGISTVPIYVHSTVYKNSYIEFSSSYKESVLQVKGLLEDLASGKKIDYERVTLLSSQVFSRIQENDYIVKCLQEIRKAHEYTYTHCLNTAFYSMLIGKWLDFSEREIEKVIQSGLIHDIGKSQISIKILNKRGVLTKEEYELIKKHTILGYDMLDGIECIDTEIKRAVLLHHERVDRSGYPFGADSDHVNMYAKFVAVADVFDAMTSERVYKGRTTPFEAFEMFNTIGLGIFDTTILNVFIRNIAPYYVGSNVMLNNGLSGEIVYIPPQDIAKPIIYVDSEYIDLSRNNNLKLTCMV